MVKMMSDIFPSINPIRIRYEKARDVIRFENRLLKMISKDTKKNVKVGTGNKTRVPAGDNWV